VTWTSVKIHDLFIADLKRFQSFFYTGHTTAAFSHAGPATWNALPDHIRTAADPVKFRKLLKSHYFRQAFNIRVDVLCLICV